MKSSTGKYYIGLDHVRALAAFMVFSWHFLHINGNHRAEPIFFPLSLLTEGHTGVALFMTLSGYLFAKLLEGRNVSYPAFLWNRALRLLPLLVLVIVLVGILKYSGGGQYQAYLWRVAEGLIKPTLPNGGWSITVEFHFYLILPALMFFTSRSKYSALVFIFAAILIRYAIFLERGEVQVLAYSTIIGRVDQFILGIVAFQNRQLFQNKHLFAGSIFFSFCAFYWYFESLGGFYDFPRYPSPSPLWIFVTTIEGLAYGILISWYDNSFSHSNGRLSRFIAQIGAYSYSIYLLHFFFVFRFSNWINDNLVGLSNVYIALAFAPIAFLLMVPIGYLSFRYIESPALKFRSDYLR